MKAGRLARREALASGKWERVLAVADAYRRIGERAGLGREADDRTHALYVEAFSLGRHAASLEGVLRAGEAFADVDDRAMVEACLLVAEALSEGDPEREDDVRDFRSHFAPWLPRAHEAAGAQRRPVMRPRPGPPQAGETLPMARADATSSE